MSALAIVFAGLWAVYASLTSSELRQELSRLEGHEVIVKEDKSNYYIINAAGEGPARIGIIEARGRGLWLIEDGLIEDGLIEDGLIEDARYNPRNISESGHRAKQRSPQQRTRNEWQLRGRLAIPRIAGPGYKVWVVGEIRAGELWARRLGILRSPHR